MLGRTHHQFKLIRKQQKSEQQLYQKDVYLNRAHASFPEGHPPVSDLASGRKKRQDRKRM